MSPYTIHMNALFTFVHNLLCTIHIHVLFTMYTIHIRAQFTVHYSPCTLHIRTLFTSEHCLLFIFTIHKIQILSFLKLCLNADSSKTEKVSFLYFWKIVETFQYCARDLAKLTLGYNLARVEPLSL